MFHIVYSCGDRTRLAVVEICAGMEYELNDYDVASRRSHDTEDEAYQYAKKLASDHNLILESETAYLD